MAFYCLFLGLKSAQTAPVIYIPAKPATTFRRLLPLPAMRIELISWQRKTRQISAIFFHPALTPITASIAPMPPLPKPNLKRYSQTPQRFSPRQRLTALSKQCLNLTKHWRNSNACLETTRLSFTRNLASAGISFERDSSLLYCP